MWYPLLPPAIFAGEGLEQHKSEEMFSNLHGIRHAPVIAAYILPAHHHYLNILKQAIPAQRDQSDGGLYDFGKHLKQMEEHNFQDDFRDTKE